MSAKSAVLGALKCKYTHALSTGKKQEEREDYVQMQATTSLESERGVGIAHASGAL